MSRFTGWIANAAVLALASVFAGCGGGGGGGASANTGPSYVAGVYAPSSQLKNLCANPRMGSSQYSGPYPDKQGSTLQENLWLRSWTNEYYLWYGEVSDIDPGGMSALTYFDLLKTNAITPSGRAKDRFHFTYDTAVWESLAQAGTDVGYGAEWLLLSGSWSATPRNVVVAYVHPNTPAAQLATPIKRGEKVTSVDGVAIDSASLSTIGAALFPDTTAGTHTIGLQDPVTSAVRTVTLQPAIVSLASVQNVKPIPTSNGTVGYLQFNDHLSQSEVALRDAIQQFQTAGVSDLIVDMRYNGGGYLAIASELAYMIAGTKTSGHTFESTQFNSKYPTTNPITGSTLTPTPFFAASGGFSLPSGTPLPTLNLSRVYVLTGANTCSASESLINGLRGINVQVYQIGATTCGKPYGFYPADNCGTTYFSIQFRSVNELGFSDYGDGFYPANTVAPSGIASVPGCSVIDDFKHALGDVQESRLAAALNYRLTGACPTPPTAEPTSLGKSILSASTGEALDPGEGRMLKSPLRENTWYR